MDSIFFNAYNTCDIQTQTDMLSNDIEFFYDKGGVSTSKSDIVASTKKNICGKVTRTLIKGSIEVYPIHQYGAVEIGYHKFFNNQEPDAKSIPSKFITIWKKEHNKWLMTKVISLH
ncbi:nuclear transport factor 2 family protein [Tenacibaculum sediminilitoris]|uniref:nuclear transport factor 2 family protein n=1 Tax=Tenacibaculum sediminilitoris TaxID=1820334 RepID=UPI0038B5DD5E